ncbi:E3 ubiquitin-protein ligase TRAIP [Episyrphus balteatus]|uniref:E3 ubiquitin-protein ligase TRAIP n=1 Tax=Episyrphus balteatus TaxID=286459 RepID=UPI0024859A00|nr:E3 ubiquitin-protein ligase TRAIP [Episyrphus balteatus]
MLNLNCVICAELFTHTADVYVTKCGHMFHYSCLCQWLERSKTCPQCRNRCTDANVHRVYFNLANLDTSTVDIGSLQEKLDNAELKVQVAEKDLRKAEEQVKNLKATQKKCMKTISGLEQKIEKNDFVILSYSEQLKMVKQQANEAESLRKEVKSLKDQITLMENVSSIITSTAQDAEKLLKEESNPMTLGVWVSALKRELRTCESRKMDLRNALKVVQNDLRREIDLRKKREERLSQLESENYNLSQKVIQLEFEKEKEKDKEKTNKSHTNDSPSTSNHSNNNRVANLQKETKRLSLSPTVESKKIEDSDSPYFNIKSSGIPFSLLRLGGLKGENRENAINKELQYNSDLSEKYTIFKKPRLMIPPSGLTSSLKPGLGYDGFGGTQKMIDEEDKQRIINKKATTQSLSNRLKAGKLRKFPSAGSGGMDNFLNKS